MEEVSFLILRPLPTILLSPLPNLFWSPPHLSAVTIFPKLGTQPPPHFSFGVQTFFQYTALFFDWKPFVFWQFSTNLFLSHD